MTTQHKFKIIKDVSSSDSIYTCFRNSEVEEQADMYATKKIKFIHIKEQCKIPLGFQNNLAHGTHGKDNVSPTTYVRGHDCRGFVKFWCRRSVGFFSRAFSVFLKKESNKRRRKQPGKLMAESRSQPVNLPGARSLMNPLLNHIILKEHMHGLTRTQKLTVSA